MVVIIHQGVGFSSEILGNKLMNKIRYTGFILTLLICYSTLAAEGFVSDKQLDVDLEKWQCRYCPEVKPWDVQLEASFGTMDNKEYRFANYSGIDDGTHFYLNGDVKMQQENGLYWNTSFQHLGLDSFGLESIFGKQSSYELQFDFQKIPIRKYQNLTTPFTNPGSMDLVLPNNWLFSDDARNFNDRAVFSSFNLKSEWERLGINYRFNGDDNWSFKTSYRRLDKEGVRESSDAQILNATYLPFPIKQTSEDFLLSAHYLEEQWLASVNLTFSRFSDDLDGVSYQLPYLALVSGSEFGQVATDPDNTATNISAKVRYRYAPKSFIVSRYSLSQFKQDQGLLPYTTNVNLLSPLPFENIGAKVASQDFSMNINHWINSDWKVRFKYRMRKRDNKTPQINYQPVIDDVYVASSLTNLPYDLDQQSAKVELTFKITRDQKIDFNYLSKRKERNFQSVHKTSDEGYEARYQATFFDQMNLNLSAESFKRDSSQLQLIDYLGVTDNPLMQRFNVAEREQDKFKFQLAYLPTDTLSVSIGGEISEQDYNTTVLGLTNNQQHNFNLDFGWRANQSTLIDFYYQQEKIETEQSGSASFSIPDWTVDNVDDVESYGMSLRITKLMNDNLDVTLDVNRSDANTSIVVSQNSQGDQLPALASQWTKVKLKVNYRYSEKINIALSYHYQDFKSEDFAIDGVNPGTAVNLITFGAFSQNYNVNYWLLSTGYRF